MPNRYAVDVIDGTFVDAEVSVPMEPRFDNDPHLSDVVEALRRREPVFHREAAGVSHENRLQGTASDFWEVGASGRSYSRDYVLETLELRYREPVRDVWYVEDFQVREVAEVTYLVTYTLLQGERVTRRSTLWKRSENDWVILYHQGTPVP